MRTKHKKEIPLISTENREGEMHCIEPMPATFEKLLSASETLHLLKYGLIIKNLAISTSNSVIQFPSSSSESGVETWGIDSCLNKRVRNRSLCKNVTVYSLDSYVDKFVKSSGPINILQVDVEGWDFNVLFGGSKTLDRTHYLEFEYHNKGMRKDLILTDAIRLYMLKVSLVILQEKGTY